MAEIPFEAMLIALESTRGTPVDPPTHYANFAGKINPKQEKYRPDESRGTLIEHYRSTTTRRWCEWEGEGPADVRLLPLFAHMAIDGSITPTTPGGGTLSRLWTAIPTITTDDIDSATLYWGDPNVQWHQAAYCMIDELKLLADASSEDGVMMEISGQGQFPNIVTPASIPAQLTPPLLVPGDMQLWLDTSSAIGTTEITGRFISTEITIQTGVTYKWLAAGAGSSRTFSRTGRKKRHAELKIVLEFLDDDQYDLYADNNGDTIVKARVRFNGPIIEAALRYYVEFDCYGPLELEDWGEHEDSNRTLELMIVSEYDSTLGADFALRVQNNSASL